MAGACALVAIALILVRLGSVRGNVDWIYAWVALLFAGADLVLVPITSWLNVVSPLYDHLFATFLLSGTLRFVGLEKELRRLWLVSAVVCLFRIAVQPFMPLITGAVTATLVIGISSLVSFILLFKDAQKESLPATQAMSFAFLAPGGVQLFFLVSRLQGDVISGALFAYVVMSSMLAMAQLTLLLERARRETERNRETLAMMAQAAPVGLCLTDHRGSLEAINPSACRLLGLDADAKTNLHEYLEQLDVKDTHRDAFTIETSNTILQVVRKQIPVGNRLVGEIWFFEDISAHIQLGELIPKAATLETTRNIAANIAHVFNNQLTVISGNAELIELDSDKGNETARYFENVKAAVEQCRQLTQDFLILTQDYPGPRRPMDLREALANLDHTTSLQVRSAGDTAVLDVDPKAFSRAIRELLTNSEEAGASEVTIDCTLVEDGFMQLKVKDNGQGIDSQATHRVFEPFFSMKEQPLGSGLGLSVVDSIVRAHGGKTDVNALEGGVEIMMTWPTAAGVS